MKVLISRNVEQDVMNKLLKIYVTKTVRKYLELYITLLKRSKQSHNFTQLNGCQVLRQVQTEELC